MEKIGKCAKGAILEQVLLFFMTLNFIHFGATWYMYFDIAE